GGGKPFEPERPRAMLEVQGKPRLRLRARVSTSKRDFYRGGGLEVVAALGLGMEQRVDLENRVNDLAGEALRLESMGNLAGAVGVWRQVMGLLPVGSVPYRQIEQRVGQLAGGFLREGENWDAGTRGHGDAGIWGGPPRAKAQDDSLGVAVAKTAGSMV